MDQQITQLGLHSFVEQSAGKKVVLLYPRTSYRTVYLSYFLNSARDRLAYYAIPQAETPLETWLADLIVACRGQVDDTFGQHLQQALTVRQKPERLGEALAADLNACRPLVFLLDQFDYTPLSPQLDRFIIALVAGLTDAVQVAVSSRQLTYQPWYDLVAAGQAVVFGTERLKDQGMFTLETDPKPRLEVYAFGQGHVLINGQRVTSWDGSLPRQLFYYFIDHPRATRDEIFQVFWPGLSIRDATNVFHVTKRKLNECLERTGGLPDTGYDLTEYHSGFYVPNPNLIRYYDAADFQCAAEKAFETENPLEMERLLRQAIHLYRAAFLETIEMEWVTARRQQCRQLYAQTLIQLGRLEYKRENTLVALGLFCRTLKEKPEREDVHREVLKIYHQLGWMEDFHQHYRSLADSLQTQLHIPPSPETVMLYQELGS